MNGIIPEISISIEQGFAFDGTPDTLRYTVSANIDTADEISYLGRIQFENVESLVALYNALGTFLRMHDITIQEQKGGDK